ncbi:hypothetical protein GGF31_000995 [Allomyces arbusculus]|nr:hypothetical protein GGF31_000995 [Allomyces arbusculus]
MSSKLVAFLAVLLAVLAVSVRAQSCGNGADDTFKACLANAATRQQATCQPLQSAQGNPWFTCMCTNAAEVVQCYAQCPGRSGEFQVAQSSQTSYCDAAERTKPQTSTSSTTSATKATATASATASSTAASPSATSTAASKGSSAQALAASGSSGFAVAAAAVALVAALQ